jgi:hypothetical protein
MSRFIVCLAVRPPVLHGFFMNESCQKRYGKRLSFGVFLALGRKFAQPEGSLVGRHGNAGASAMRSRSGQLIT